MKNKINILIIVLLFVSINTTFSQARLDYSKQEIIEEFSQLEYIENISENGLLSLSYDMGRVNTYYYFNDDNVCKLTAIVPKTPRVFKFYYKYYQEKHLRFNDSQWIAEDNDRTANIYLKSLDDGTRLFLWTFE